MASTALRRRAALVAVLSILVLVALLLARRGIVEVRQLRALDAVCEATAEGRFADAREESELLVEAFDDAELRNRLLQCRCGALAALGEEQRCRDELAATLAGSSPEELAAFDRDVVRTGIDRLIDSERAGDAWRVLADWREAVGDATLLQGREFLARLRLEPEDELLAEFVGRLDDGTLPFDVPILIASRDLRLGRPDRARQILAGAPPREASSELRRLWFLHRAEASARIGDLAALEETLQQWSADGLSEGERLARLGLAASAYALLPGERAIALMRGALEREAELDRELAVAVRSRLVRVLASRDRLPAALELYDQSIAEYGELIGLDREELERLARPRMTTEAPGAARLSVVSWTDLRPTDVLVVSPPSSAPVDAPFVEVVPTRGRVQLRRAPGELPIWWLVRSAPGEVVARGTAWVREGEPTTVAVERDGGSVARSTDPPAVAAAEARSAIEWQFPERAPADGRRRVLLLVWDSADWRILRYLQAAGEVPVFSALLERSTAGVLLSDPPYTAAALQRLVAPGDRTMGLFELVHQLGEEVEALNFVGRNPVQFLEPVLERENDLFTTLGDAGKPSLNLLRAVGSIDAGRNAEMVGPGGRTQITGLLGKRELSDLERAAIPGIARDEEQHDHLLGEAAADYDTLVRLLDQGEADFIAARIASLDLMTHGAFGELSDAGQHHGDLALLRFYRYLDLRLAEVLERLDGDDVLLLISDHGALSSFEHDPRSLLVLYGAPYPAGSALAARPDLSGVPRQVAELLGVEVAWPDGGFSDALERPTTDAPETGS